MDEDASLRFFSPILWAPALLLLLGCQGRRPGPVVNATHPDPQIVRGQLFVLDTLASNERRPAALEDSAFAALAAEADYILVGEGHGVECDHLVQARIVEALASTDRKPALGLEMVGEDRQPVLDRFNSGELGLEELPAALDWSETWGHPFSLYEPVFDAARAGGVSAFALNVPPKVVRAYSDKGPDGLAAAQRKWLPQAILLPGPEQRATLRQEFERHREAMPGKKARRFDLERFFRVQSLWDTKMAERAAAVRRELDRPLLVLAGSFHVERGWGIAYRLQTLDPGARILLVGPWRGPQQGKPLPDAAEADVFFFCPMSHASRLGFTLEEDKGKVSVVDVEADSRAAKAGFQAGDVLRKVQGEDVEAMYDLHRAALKAREEKRALAILVGRGADTLELRLDVSKPAAPDE